MRPPGPTSRHVLANMTEDIDKLFAVSLSPFAKLLWPLLFILWLCMAD